MILHGGKDVYFCNSREEIEATIKRVFEENKDTLSVCPYLDIEYEYRTIYLDGKIEFAYKKSKPFVVGDGKNKLKTLIENIGDNKVNYSFCKDLDMNYIPAQDKKVIISWKHNLNSGAIPILIDEKDAYIDKVKAIAKKAGDTMNSKFASIDISQTKAGDLFVMEVNASVCMNKFSEIVPNGYKIAKEIYGKAIDKMFE